MAARDAHFLDSTQIAAPDGDTARPYAWEPESQAGDRAMETHQSAYLKQVFLHPLHLALVLALMLSAILTASLWLIPFALVGEVVLGSVYACSRTFRRLVGGEATPGELMLPAERRAALMAQMSEEHREELQRLEVQVGSIRENSGYKDESLSGQPYDLTLLLRGYADLAAAHRAHATAVAVTDRSRLVDELRALERSSSSSNSPSLKQVIDRRQEVVHRRLACWDRNTRTMEEIEHQLATISNLIGLIHEKSMLQGQPGWVSEEVDRVIEDLERQELALLELGAG